MLFPWLFEGGISKEAIQKALTPLNLTIVPFDEEMACEAGRLRLLNGLHSMIE